MTHMLLRYYQRPVGRAVMAAVIFVLVAVILRSVIPFCPVRSADVVIYVDHSMRSHSLIEVRKYIGNSADVTVSYTRYLYEEANPQNFLQLAGGNFRSMNGEFPLLLSNRLPEYVTGRWCSSLSLSWQPSFSQREFHTHTPPVCFEASEYE